MSIGLVSRVRIAQETYEAAVLAVRRSPSRAAWGAAFGERG